MRMIYDLEPPRFRELMFGTTGGIALFFLLGCLCHFNIEALQKVWRFYPRHGIIFLWFFSLTIIFSYLLIIFNSSDAGSILRNLIIADGTYQRKGSLLTILYIVYLLAYLKLHRSFEGLRLWNFIILFPVTAVMLFYSQFVRSNSAFATILLMYLFTLFLEFSSLGSKARLRSVTVGAFVLFGGLVYAGRNLLELYDVVSHFRIFGYGKFDFSSIISRVDLFSRSLDQFNFGPIFGDMNSDSKAGQAGKYPHNLLAHALTHLGLIGFILMTFACVLLFMRSRVALIFKNIFKMAPPAHRQVGISAIIMPILLISILFQTITWSPFWFTVGLFFPFSKMKN